MKINEVEQLVGVTKRNIRFYEKEGLLSPVGRTTATGTTARRTWRPCGRIKLLGKLDSPWRSIRGSAGTLTLTDGVRRHIIQLERPDNLATIRSLS